MRGSGSIDAVMVMVIERTPGFSVTGKKGRKCCSWIEEHPFPTERENALALCCTNTSWLEGTGLVGLSLRSWHPDWLKATLGVLVVHVYQSIYHEGWQRRMIFKGVAGAPGTGAPYSYQGSDIPWAVSIETALLFCLVHLDPVFL